MSNQQEQIRLLEKQLRAANARFYKLKELNGSALSWVNTGHLKQARETLQAGQKV